MRVLKRFLSLLLSAVLVAGLIPVTPSAALAEDNAIEIDEEPLIVEDDQEAIDDMAIESVSETDEVITIQVDESVLDDDSQIANEGMPTQNNLLSAQTISYSQPVNHTKQEIRDFITNHPFDISSASTYSSQPSITSPFSSGALSSDSTQNALNAINVLRYIAGVGYNVTNNSTYQSYAQAAALVNKVNDSLSHYPTRPVGMDNALYSLGYDGAGRSIIGSSSINAAASILRYFDDLDFGNVGTAEHRRWLISPSLDQVGIGQVDTYNATYVNAVSNESGVTDVAWPAHTMPTGLIDTSAQWSFSTDTRDIGSPSSIEITITRRRMDGNYRSWKLSSSDITVNDVGDDDSYSHYDMNGWIVWSMPNIDSYRDGDVFDVAICGDRSTKSYRVEFFDLYPVDDIRIVTQNNTTILSGDTCETIISSGAQDYCFIPGFSQEAYPSHPGLQRMADSARQSQVVTYTSSNQAVAVVNPRDTHEHFVVYNNDRIWCDWLVSIIPKKVGATTITAKLSNGVSKSFRLMVRKKNIDPAKDTKAQIFNFGYDTFTYNGVSQHPTYSLYYNGSTLGEGTHYRASYENDIDAGLGTVVLKGIGDYDGTVQKTFTINPAYLSSATIAPLEPITYTSSALTPIPSITYNGRALLAGTDYEITYENNTNVGIATIILTGKGNYTGTKTGHFSIVAAPISGATIAEICNQTYTGSVIEPKLSVMFNDIELDAERDYDVVYSKNTNTGTAIATLTGKGNFYGTATTTFEIVAKSIAPALISAIAEQTYTGLAIEPMPSVTLDSNTLIFGIDYFFTYINNVNAGTADVRLTGKGNYSGTASTTFNIARAPLADASIKAIPNQTYLGEARKPSVTAILGDRTLIEETDYTLSYDNNVEVGLAAATLTGKGNYQGTSSITFEITIPFVDVAMNTGHVEDICWLYESQISQGWLMPTGSREYRPLANVARADMAAFLFRLARRWNIVSDTWQPSGTTSFNDVNNSTSHYREIMWLAEQGVSKGWVMKDGTAQFRPYANVARADMAAFLARLYRLRGGNAVGSGGFLDVTDSTAHAADINWLAASGISKGWNVPTGSEFRPYANVARADMAAFLSRLYKLA